MPRRCVVPGCHKKHKNKIPRIPTFQFPRNPKILEGWIHNLNRPNWRPTLFSGLCANHFRLEDFKAGSNLSKRPRLKENAIPTIFHHLPKSHKIVSTEDVWYNESSVEMELQSVPESDVDVISEQIDDFVLNFANFKAKFKDRLNLENYHLFENDEKCVFYQIENSQVTECMISVRISINSSLKIRIMIDDSDDYRHFDRLQITNSKLVDWSQIENLLETYRYGASRMKTEDDNSEKLLKRALQYLILAQTSSINFGKADKLDIIINQLENNIRRGPKYNSRTIKMSFLLYSHSHATLELLRNFLYLPSLRYLQQLSSNMQISKNFIITTKKDGDLSDPENYVALVIDELYIDRSLQYSDDTFVGTAILNPLSDPKSLLVNTKTILTYTIKSIFGNLQEIVRMTPAIYPFGDVIYTHTRDVVDYIHKIGFNVKLMIADTSKNSQKIFQRFSDQNHYFPNPKYPDQQTYLLYDVLQIMKDIRNDWLGLINADRTFIYPDIDTFEIKEASFSDLETLFESDKLNAMKKAPKLTANTINPNDSDKHNNITLVDNIFHESTILALQENDMGETGDFCATIKKWYDIVITNEPILVDSDERFIYLENFVAWIKTWRTSRSNPGRLKPTTFQAIETTTKTLIELIKFSFLNCQAEFLRLSKLQKDSVENRFKFYESKIKSLSTQCAENTEEPEIDEICTSVKIDELNDPLGWERSDVDTVDTSNNLLLTVDNDES